MPRAPDADGIGAVARRLLASGAVGDDSLRGAHAGRALPVLAPGGAQHSWFVPFTQGAKLVAFAQLLPGGELLRFSSFQRRPGDLASCPESADWLDPARIRAHALAAARDGEVAGDPVLSYVRSPEQVAWSVPLTRGSETRRVWVTGTHAFPADRGG